MALHSSPLEQAPIPPATQKTESSEGQGTEQSQHTWFSHLAYPSESDSDTGKGDEEDMDITQLLPAGLSPTHQPQDPTPPVLSASIQDLIAAAIADAQRAAR